jgi:MFS family permease
MATDFVPGGDSRPPGPWYALSNRSFRRLWIASWLWMTCMMMELAVASWLVLQLTDSPFSVALVGTFRMLPMFVVGIAAGQLSDRLPKKHLMVSAQLLHVTGASVMLCLIVTGWLQPWHIYVCTFLIGTAMTTDFPARRGYFAQVFESSKLNNVIALETAAMMGSFMLGPLFGGLLIELVDFTGAYIVMVTTFVVSLLIVLSVRPVEPLQPSGRRKGMIKDIIEGMKFARNNPTLWSLFLVTAVVNFLGFPFMQLVPVIARDVLGIGPFLYGLLAASMGIGSFGGALLLASIKVRKPQAYFCVGALILQLSIALFAYSEIYPLSFLILIVAGIGQSGFASMQSAITLQAAPPEMRGRAVGVILLAIGLHPLGAIVLGNLAELINPQHALGILGITGFILVLSLRTALPAIQGWPWQNENSN